MLRSAHGCLLEFMGEYEFFKVPMSAHLYPLVLMASWSCVLIAAHEHCTMFPTVLMRDNDPSGPWRHYRS